MFKEFFLSLSSAFSSFSRAAPPNLTLTPLNDLAPTCDVGATTTLLATHHYHFHCILHIKCAWSRGVIIFTQQPMSGQAMRESTHSL